MQRFKNILYVAAPDTNSLEAVERAVTLALSNQACLTVVEVIEVIPPKIKLPNQSLSHSDLQAKIVAEHRNKLKELVASWNQSLEIRIEVLVGNPFLEVIRKVLRSDCDLIIKSAESGGLFNRVFGSDDQHLLRKCPCPVWLLNSTSPKTYQRVLAAVDLDDFYMPKELNTRHLLNLQILEMASSLALSESAELHIAYAFTAMGESMMQGGFMQSSDQEVADYVEEIRQRSENNLAGLMDEVTTKLGKDTMEYLKPKKHLPKGLPRKEIPALVDKIDADLVIMGTVARTGIPGFIMGNTAENILNQISCSVLAIKPSGFETPVTLAD